MIGLIFTFFRDPREAETVSPVVRESIPKFNSSKVYIENDFVANEDVGFLIFESVNEKA